MNVSGLAYLLCVLSCPLLSAYRMHGDSSNEPLKWICRVFLVDCRSVRLRFDKGWAALASTSSTSCVFYEGPEEEAMKV